MMDPTAPYLNEPKHQILMHARQTALPVSVPGRLQFVEASLESLSVHHVLIVGICLFDGFVDRTAKKGLVSLVRGSIKTFEVPLNIHEVFLCIPVVLYNNFSDLYPYHVICNLLTMFCLKFVSASRYSQLAMISTIYN